MRDSHSQKERKVIKMAKKTGLGKGLDALFSDKPLTQEEEEKILKDGEEVVQNIKIIEIEPNKKQPRKRFDNESLEDLAKSIKRYGVIQPIIVNKKDTFINILSNIFYKLPFKFKKYYSKKHQNTIN